MTATAATTPDSPATQDLLQSLAVLAGAQWRGFPAAAAHQGLPSLQAKLLGELVRPPPRRGLAAAHEGLTSVQAKLLGQLVRPLPMRELAALLGCDASNVTGIVDRLEAQGLARREADPHDRRVKRVIATSEGRETVRRVRAEMH